MSIVGLSKQLARAHIVAAPGLRDELPVGFGTICDHADAFEHQIHGATASPKQRKYSAHSVSTTLAAKKARLLAKHEAKQRKIARGRDSDFKIELIVGSHLASDSCNGCSGIDTHKVVSPRRHNKFDDKDVVEHAQMPEFDGDFLQCCICLEDYPEAQLKLSGDLCCRPECQKTFCGGCFAQYLSERVSASRFALPPMRCVACHGRVPTASWTPFVDGATSQLYQQSASDALVLRCPSCDEMRTLSVKHCLTNDCAAKAIDAFISRCRDPDAMQEAWLAFEMGELLADHFWLTLLKNGPADIQDHEPEKRLALNGRPYTLLQFLQHYDGYKYNSVHTRYRAIDWYDDDDSNAYDSDDWYDHSDWRNWYDDDDASNAYDSDDWYDHSDWGNWYGRFDRNDSAGSHSYDSDHLRDHSDWDSWHVHRSDWEISRGMFNELLDECVVCGCASEFDEQFARWLCASCKRNLSKFSSTAIVEEIHSESAASIVLTGIDHWSVASPCSFAKRLDANGNAYTLDQLQQWYGPEEGKQKWAAATIGNITPVLQLIVDVERRTALHLAHLRRSPKIRTPCCKHEYCFRCHVGTWHSGTTCEDHSSQGIEIDVQFCPVCKVPTQRTEGCSSMMCPCGAEWHWTGGEDSDGYD